ncbi:unnamed protein product, partial [Pylaiella littoralis]
MPPPPPQQQPQQPQPQLSTATTGAAAGKPVLAEWMKDGGIDDSDADTANSLFGGAPSSRGSTFSCATPAAASSTAAVGSGHALVAGVGVQPPGTIPVEKIPAGGRAPSASSGMGDEARVSTEKAAP